MAALEALEQANLVELKRSPGVLKLINHQFNLDEWSDVGQGWTGRGDRLRLMGWSKARRVIVIRRARKIDLEDDKKVAVKRRGRKSNVLQACRVGTARRKRGDQELGVRGAGVRHAVQARANGAALPRPC